MFGMQINIKVFYKATKLFSQVIARYAGSTRNSKFVVSLQYFKKEGKDKVDFLHADKHHIFLQFNPINLGGHGQSCPNYPK